MKLWPYVADLACLEAKLIVELDGGQQSEAKDARRTAFLEAQGFHILRFRNHDVWENLEGVFAVVSAALAASRE